MFEPSVIELSRGALRKNVRYLHDRVGRGVRLTSVVKGNAYGHGVDMFVPLAESCGIRSFAVFGADEAAAVDAVRSAGSDLLVMGHMPSEAIEWAVERGVGFFVYDTGRLREAIAAAGRTGRAARVHLEVETGLHRTGFEPDELARAVGLLSAHPDAASVEGLCTHFAGAESSSNALRIRKQLEAFDAHTGWLAARGISPRMRHVACSAAALTMPETRMDMVRVGIALYGYWPSKEIEMRVILEEPEARSDRRRRDPLRRVITWRSRVIATKSVPAGELVGYGSSCLTTRRQRFAVVPVGYSQGFTRALTNIGHVLIRGRRAPVSSAVNMSLMIVDVTDIRGVEVGDDVVLIGKQGGHEISVGSFSDMSRFLNYEALVRLPSRIPRVVVD